jgi:hypothetical protein
MLKEPSKAINCNPELGFEHGSSPWEDIVENKLREVLGKGIEMIDKS